MSYREKPAGFGGLRSFLWAVARVKWGVAGFRRVGTAHHRPLAVGRAHPTNPTPYRAAYDGLPALTPMMQQFRAAKDQNPGMLVLFRNGDFYELFEDDAEFGHKILGLTLTKRDNHIPMAGFPQHKLEHYLGVLLKAGHRVAVCEQMEAAGASKGPIRREVNRVVTPGTVTEDDLLDARRPNYLAAVVRGKAGIVGLAWADLSTGFFAAMDVPANRLGDELARLCVVECLLPEDQADGLSPLHGPQPAADGHGPPGLDVRPDHGIVHDADAVRRGRRWPGSGSTTASRAWSPPGRSCSTCTKPCGRASATSARCTPTAPGTPWSSTRSPAGAWN